MKGRVVFAAILLACFVSSFAPVRAQGSLPVLPEDLYRFKFVASPAISPDASKAAFVLETVNGPNDRYDTQIDVVDLATGALHAIPGGGRDGDPAWSPDSTRLTFTRGSKGKPPQVYVYRPATGSVAKLTSVKDGASGAVWSHDGKHIALRVVAKDSAHDSYVDFEAAGFKPKKSQRKSDIRIIKEMHFQANGVGYVYDRRPHIWIANADGTNAHALTSGEWAERNAQWSPDDRTIVFDSLRRNSPSLGPNDIYTIAVTGGAMHRVPSSLTSNAIFGIDRRGRLWSTRGGIQDPAEYPQLVVSGLDGSNARTVWEKNKVSLGDIVLADMGEPGGLCGPFFSPDNRFAVFNVSAPGYTKLVKLDTATGAMTDLTRDNGTVAECSMDAQGKRVVYTFGDFTHLRELYTLDPATGSSKKITSFNDAYASSHHLSVPQPFTVKDADGLSVLAWFMPAAGDRSGARPTILDIHGGPQTEFGNSFFHEFQVLASRGYNVVFSDPRGSVGFGYDFQEGLAKHWGDAMFDDVQHVMDAAVKRPDVDVNRLGVSGGSYGGYATLWVISHTHRYKTAIAERVVSKIG
ncbi:MAG: S9 family peptidase, partial [Candidatus Eremiobacteraeota bacterium]|nr:S9 family peptidase [Candidatus Eremiobacteraeota bacterium]